MDRMHRSAFCTCATHITELGADASNTLAFLANQQAEARLRRKALAAGDL